MILDACDCVRDSKHTKRTCDFVKAIDGDSGNLNTSQHLSGGSFTLQIRLQC